MKRAKRLILFTALVAGIWFVGLFNPISNAHFLFDHEGELSLDVSNSSKELYSDDEVSIKRVALSRSDETFSKKLLDLINSPRLYLITFRKNKENFYISYEPNGQTSRQNAHEETIFSINSSFYDPEMNSLGEIIIQSKEYGKPSLSSGYFKVIDGVAYTGPKSLFDGLNGSVEYSCQAHPSVMKDGIIWPYILSESLNKKAWERKTLRNLSGIDADGHIVFLVSGDGALLSVKEISQIAEKLNIKTATLFDAGSALQYSLKAKGYHLQFSSFNNQLNLGVRMDDRFKNLTGYRFFHTSPVFINYRVN